MKYSYFPGCTLKNKAKDLDRYARAKPIKEKRRCWQVTYAHNVHFHMDVVPAIKRARFISITDHNEEFDIYE